MSELYAVVDTARDPRLYKLAILSNTAQCLFAGELSEEIKQVSPYLVSMHDAGLLMRAWEDYGQGQHWGIFIRTSMGMNRLRQHLRKFNLAKLPDGRVVLFRWWDPRVLGAYLETCSAGDLNSWFSGVEEVFCEDRIGDAFCAFSNVGGVVNVNYPMKLRR